MAFLWRPTRPARTCLTGSSAGRDCPPVRSVKAASTGHSAGMLTAPWSAWRNGRLQPGARRSSTRTASRGSDTWGGVPRRAAGVNVRHMAWEVPVRRAGDLAWVRRATQSDFSNRLSRPIPSVYLDGSLFSKDVRFRLVGGCHPRFARPRRPFHRRAELGCRNQSRRKPLESRRPTPRLTPPAFPRSSGTPHASPPGNRPATNYFRRRCGRGLAALGALYRGFGLLRSSTRLYDPKVNFWPRNEKPTCLSQPVVRPVLMVFVLLKNPTRIPPELSKLLCVSVTVDEKNAHYAWNPKSFSRL